MSRSLAASLMLLVAGSAAAETFCVSTATQFLNAVNSANASPEDSTINVVTGAYDFNAPAGGVAINVTGSSSLTIAGGFSTGCPVGAQANPELTLLRVANSGRLMNIFFNAGSSNNVTITRIGFRQGDTALSTAAGCLTAESDAGATGRLSLLSTSFRLCSSSSTTSALRVVSRGLDLEVSNSVFADNASQNGVIALSIQSGSSVYLTNNTIAFNPRLSNPNPGPAGLQLGMVGSNAILWMINNVIYGNGSGQDTDVLFNTDIVGIANHNIIGRQNPFPASLVESDNRNTNPLLVSSVNLRPIARSPLRNAGNNNAPLGTPTQDLDGNYRPQGLVQDIGAYEFLEVFSSGFEN